MTHPKQALRDYIVALLRAVGAQGINQDVFPHRKMWASTALSGPVGRLP